MPKTVTFDTLVLQGANVWVDPITGAIRMEMNYQVSASQQSAAMAVTRNRQVQELLLPEERSAIIALTARLKAALEQEELT